MLKRLSLVLLVVAAVGCKSSGSSSTAAQGSADETGQNRAATARTGKINLKPLRNGAMPRMNGGPLELDMGDSEDGGSDRANRRAERMAKIDKDGDGEISPEERDQARKERAAEIEAKLDTNKDGTVSPEERAAAQKERAETLRTKLDTDGDGRLTLEEMANSRFAQLNANTLDVNKDGVISTDELQAGLPTRQRFGGGPGAMGRFNSMPGMTPKPDVGSGQ